MQQGSYPIGNRTINVNTDTATGVVTGATCDIPLNKLAQAIQQYLGLTLPLAIASGGTGAQTAAQARVNLGLGSIATQNANAVAITGGNVDGTPIGATTPSSGSFTTVTATTPISVGNGGTGAGTFTTHGVLIGEGTGAISSTGAGTAGQALISGGPSADPAFGTLGVSGGGTGATSAGATAANNIGALAIVNNLSDLGNKTTATSNLNYLQGGAGAVTRTVPSKLQEIVSVKDYGAVGDGVTVDTSAFNAAISANPGKFIYVPDPSVNYVIDSTITLPNNTVLVGQNKFSTKIFKKGTNDMFSIGDGAGFRDIWLDGQGATYAGGRGILIGAISSSDGHQNITNTRIINFAADCIAFTNVNAGSQFYAINCEISQYNANTGSGKYAVTIVDAAQLSAVPRVFVGCEFNGSPSFNFGGCNDLFISGCFLGDLNYTLNSRSTQISNSRISNQSALSIYGHNHTIVGCDVNPQITLTSGTDNCHIGPNSLNNAPVIDNSGNGRNQVYIWSIAYTPTISTGGTAPSLGNGTLTGRWSRQGATVHVSISLTLGSTTSLGTGQLQFSLPPASPNNMDITQVTGAIQMYRAPSTNYTGVCVIPAATNLVQLLRDTSGAVTSNSPVTFTAGDSITFRFSYDVGV